MKFESKKFTKGSDEWLQFRKGFVSASDMGALLGLNPYKSRNDLLKEKRGEKIDEVIDEVVKGRWERGHILQPSVVEMYRRWLSTDIQCHEPDIEEVFFSKTKQISATPDVFFNNWKCPADVKTAHTSRAVRWLESPPLYYIVQVHCQMLCASGKKGRLIGGFFGDHPEYKDIELGLIVYEMIRSKEIDSLMIEEVSNFFKMLPNGELYKPISSKEKRRRTELFISTIGRII